MDAAAIDPESLPQDLVTRVNIDGESASADRTWSATN